MKSKDKTLERFNLSESKNILGAAQHFGYGGFAYLFSIARAIREKLETKTHLHLLEEKNIDIFFKKNPNVFDDIIPFDIKKGGFSSQTDHLVSSYEAFSVLSAWLQDIPTSYFTSLFWFWDIEELRPVYQEQLNKLKKLKQQGLYEEALLYFKKISTNNHHHAIFLAYFLAEQNYLLYDKETLQRLNDFPEIKEKTLVIPGIVSVPKDLKETPYIKRTKILIQFSGSTTPLIPIEDNVKFIANLLDLFLEIYKSYEHSEDLEWHFICNPQIYQLLQKRLDEFSLPHNFQIQESVAQADNFKLFANAKAVFLSPSLMSTYEAAFFKTPVFLLPEQNGGQPANYKKLKKNGFNAEDNITLYEVLGEDLSGDQRIKELYAQHNHLFQGETRKEVLRRVQTFLNKTKNPSINQTIQEQREGYQKIIGGFNGLEIISNHIVERIKQQPTRKKQV